MEILRVLFFALLCTAVSSRDTFIVDDSEEALKVHVPYLLNMTNDYLWAHPNLPDVIDDERWQQHLGLVHNRWVKITPNMSSAAVRSMTFFPDNGTFVLDLSSVLTYEIRSQFLYNFWIIPVIGEATIKGSAADMRITMKITAPPANQYCNDKEVQYVIETVEVAPRFVTSEVNLNPENLFTWIFGIKSFIAKIFSSNTAVLAPSVANATINATEEYFEKFYLRPQTWRYSSLSHTFNWTVLNSFCKLTMTRLGSIQAIYNATETQEFVSAGRRPEGEGVEVRQLFIQRRLMEEAMEVLHQNVAQDVEDRDLPVGMQSRLDMLTFQKFVPDASIRSSSSGETNIKVKLHVDTVGNLVYFTENKETKYAMGTYSFNFTTGSDTRRENIIWGTVGVLYEFFPLWTRDAKHGLGYFNVRLGKTKVLTKNINAQNTLIFLDRFKGFLDEIISNVFLAKLNAVPENFLFDSLGVPIEDTLATYLTTEITWDPDYSEIIVTHRN